MAIRDLKERIAALPEQPGVYLYLDPAGETLYVGRARSLRARVRSYLGAYGSSPKTDALLDEVTRLEVIVTDSLVEALALEAHLIKQRSPRFNILLRDDKNYPYLQLTTGEAFPRVLVARRVDPRDGHTYAGPFLPATLARKTMSLTHKLFGIRSCNEVINGRRGRACLEYDIKRCVAPCVENLCTPEQYAEAVEHTRLFLEGRNDELIADLKRRMAEASDDLRYEEAAQTRDAIRTVETLRDRQQKMSSVRLGDRDAFGVKVGPSGAIIQVFQMRGGRVIERVELAADVPAGAGSPERETVQAAVQQFYEERTAPPEIHLPVEIDEPEALASWLGERAGRKVRIGVPKRGDKRGLLDLATRNAALAYRSRYSDEARAGAAALDELRVVLGLPAAPRRIECFDISTLQGAETVGSMVVCEDGRAVRKQYRKYRVRGGSWGRSAPPRRARRRLAGGAAGRGQPRGRRAGPAARPVRSPARRVRPPARQARPRARRAGPPARRVRPPARRARPPARRVRPPAWRARPRARRVRPAARRAGPPRPTPACWTTSRRCARWSAGGTAGSSTTGGRCPTWWSSTGGAGSSRRPTRRSRRWACRISWRWGWPSRRSSSSPATRPSPSSSTARARPCSCCSACATRPTASRSPSTGRRGRAATCSRPWTASPAWGRAGGGCC